MQAEDIDIKQAVHGKGSAWRTYARFATGTSTLTQLLRYELITGLCAACGGALGIALRKLCYPMILGSLGRGTVIGRNVTIRGGANIHIGRNVLIDEGCLIDARGTQSRIAIGNGVIVSRHSVIRSRNAVLEIGAGSDIGANCLLATDCHLQIGRQVLIAAYVYLVAGGLHRIDGDDPVIMNQGMEAGKGVTIGDGAWIGARSSVLDGANVGAGSVIGAHSLVSRPIPEAVVAYGSPATVRRSRRSRKSS
ncbi:MAG TPA: hypothetical protein DCS43_13925 [Verrucomicrobia bacterium]|nr:hypothetical protein [Verrucomicrobiota bacterium]